MHDQHAPPGREAGALISTVLARVHVKSLSRILVVPHLQSKHCLAG